MTIASLSGNTLIMGAKVNGNVVNRLVYCLVFGESMLNDATSIVLFRTFDSMVEKSSRKPELDLQSPSLSSFALVDFCFCE